MREQSKEAGWLTGYEAASGADYESNFEIFSESALAKAEQSVKQATFFVAIDWVSFFAGVQDGIKACYNDCIFNGAAGELQ